MFPRGGSRSSPPWQSDATNEAGQRHFQGSGDPDKRINGDILLSTLHVADVGGVQVRFLRKFLLAHPGLFARNPDILAENAPMFGKRTHADNGNRNPNKRPSDIPETFSLRPFGEQITTVCKMIPKRPETIFERSEGFHPYQEKKDESISAKAGNREMQQIRRSILRKLRIRMAQQFGANSLSRHQKVTRNRLHGMTGER
jgi:hypothetical protein